MSVRVLIASPVRRKPAILAEFLRGLGGLDLSGLAVDFAFVDDNDDAASMAMLRSWVPPCGSLRVIVPQGIPEQRYDAGNDFHRWGPELCRRVAAWRNHLADLARQDHRVRVELAQEPGREQPGHRPIGGRSRRGVAGAAHR